LSEDKPYFHEGLDPKCDWALRHLDEFPVEVNRADYQKLLRVPGIGVRSAGRIMKARRSARLGFPDLKKMGVVLKRAAYFITCQGKMMMPIRLEEDYLTGMLVSDDRKKTLQLGEQGGYRQMSLFDDLYLRAEPEPEDLVKSVVGQM